VKEDLIAYARRNRAAFAKLKRRYWAKRKAHMTPAQALAVGDALREHYKSTHPSWPTEEDRQEDLASHIRVSEMLRSVKVVRR
jgi:hypothetical protein